MARPSRGSSRRLLLLALVVSGAALLAFAAVWAFDSERADLARRAEEDRATRLADAARRLAARASSAVEDALDRAEAAPGDREASEIPSFFVLSADGSLLRPRPEPLLRLDAVLDKVPASRRARLVEVLDALAAGEDPSLPPAGDLVSRAEDALAIEALISVMRARGLAASDPARSRRLLEAAARGNLDLLPTALALETLASLLSAPPGEIEAPFRARLAAMLRAKTTGQLVRDPEALPWLEDLLAELPDDPPWTERLARARELGRAAAVARLVGLPGTATATASDWVDLGDRRARHRLLRGEEGGEIGRAFALAPEPSRLLADSESGSPGGDLVLHRSGAAAFEGSLALEGPYEGWRLAAPEPLAIERPWRSLVLGALLLLVFGALVASAWAALGHLRRERELLERRGEFLATVSHQLKTPVANLRLFAETLRGGRVENAADRERMTAIIESEAGRLGELLGRFLTLSRLDAGVEGGEPGSGAALSPTLEGVLERRRAVAAERGVTMELGAVPASARVRGDAEDLVEALGNVLDNALAYSPRGGVVEVSAERCAAGWRVAIRDRGPGIAPSDRRRVFERFFRGEDARSRRGEGTGLGLPIARALVERFGGRLEIAASGEEGTTMVFELPEAPREEDPR